MDDGQLVYRARSGDHEAYELLMEEYRDAVSAVCYTFLGDFDEVQDAAQEAFVQAYLRLDSLRDVSKFGPWVREIAGNVCRQALRARKAEVSLEDLAVEPEHGDEPRRAAVRVIVREALSTLSEKTRLALTLSCINGYSQAEIAMFLDVPVNTVRSRLRIAKSKLREEMIEMVSDSLHEDKPGEQLSVGVVKEILERAHKAGAAHEAGNALQAYDEALEALERVSATMPPRQMKHQVLSIVQELAIGDSQSHGLSLEQIQKLPARDIAALMRAEILSQKGMACTSVMQKQEGIRLLEEAFGIVDRLGLTACRADVLMDLGVEYANAGMPDKANQSTQDALQAYRDVGDLAGQANCLIWLGSQRLDVKEVPEGRKFYEQAIGLLEQCGNREWYVVCKAALDLLDEVGPELYSRLIVRSNSCCCITREGSALLMAWEPGSRWGRRGEVPALDIIGPFWQIAHTRKFLDTAVAVGASWSDAAPSYSLQPLKAVVTVVSDTETLTVPAGTFHGCLVTQQVTSESDLPDSGEESRKRLNREAYCGTRRAWYAPGVGLVQIHVETSEGNEALIQLREYSVAKPSEGYLPLVIGNSWTYGWTGIPEDYAAKEVYLVAANDREQWYLEHYHYMYRRSGC